MPVEHRCIACASAGPFGKNAKNENGVDSYCKNCRREKTMAARKRRLAKGICRNCPSLRVNNYFCRSCQNKHNRYVAKRRKNKRISCEI